MSRGFDGNSKGNLNSARRKKDRRAAIAQAQREKRRRLKITERKHASGFLRVAVKAAKDCARDLGSNVQVERMGDAAGSKALFRWSEAAIQLVPVGISVRFVLGDKRGSGAATTIRVYSGRKLIRACPEELLQSGEGRAFATWLSECLAVAVERLPADKG